ncbi:MAG: hypothetical protein GC192_19680 [Bacteroidetes bacterium]|nr:hypothetical protein [Bacteroidota bacterium]
MNDLNNKKVWNEDQGQHVSLNRANYKLYNPEFELVEVYFKEVENEIVKKIQEYEDGAIVGCVAWLTSERILTALSKVSNVQIIVQKEDFLRPDINENTNSAWKRKIQKLYKSINTGFFPGSFGVSYGAGGLDEAIRCVGNYNSDKSPAFPRAHHKFLVFGKTYDSNDIRNLWQPEAVWTGSFNFSANAGMSFENAIFFKSSPQQSGHKLIMGYTQEHEELFKLSESLDWKSNWVEPEFRIGT